MLKCKDCDSKISTGSKTGYCRTCSRKHFPVWNKGLTKIEAPQLSNSGVKIGSTPYNKGKNITEEHKIKLSCTNRQISVDKFDGFTTPINKRERCKFDSSDLRKECYEKANYTCDKCNQRGGTLNAHHLEAWKINTEKRFDLDNLVCLCEKCHKLFHKIHGHNNKQKQYEEFKKAKF